MYPMHGETHLTFLINRPGKINKSLLNLQKKITSTSVQFWFYLLFPDYTDNMAIGLWLFMSPRSQ